MNSQHNRPQLESDDTKLDVVRYFRVVWRRKWMVILPVLFITSITAFGVRFLSPLYVSNAKVHVEKRTRVNKELERQIIDNTSHRTRQKDELEKVKAQVSGREFLESIARELGLQNDPGVLARAQFLHETRTPDVPAEEIAMRILVRGLRSKVRVKSVGIDTYQISISDNDPENAYVLAKVVSRNFVAEAKRSGMDKLGELFKFSSRQMQIYREKASEAENELRDYQSELIRELGQGTPVNSANIHQARSHRRRLEVDAQEAEQRVEGLKRALGDVFAPLPEVSWFRRQTVIREAEKRLRANSEDDLLTELDRMSSTSATSSGRVDPLVDGVTRSHLRNKLFDLVGQEYESTDAFYRDKIAEYVYESILVMVEREKASSLAQKIHSYSARAEAQPEKELRLRALEERLLSARNSLETFQSTVQSAELSETIMATQLAGGVTIVDPAEKPVAPLKPDKRRLVLLSLMLSLVGGMGTVFAIEYLDKSFKDIDEIERVLGLHVVGTLPRVKGGLPFGALPAQRRQRWLLASSLLVLFVVLGGMISYEQLLRRQRVSVPQARVEAILEEEEAVDDSGEDSAPAGVAEIEKWIDEMIRLQEEAKTDVTPVTDAAPVADKKEK